MRSSKTTNLAPSWRRRAGHVLGMAVLVFAGGMGGIPLPFDSFGIQSAQASDEVARSKPRIEPELLQTLQSGKPARYAIYFQRPDLSAAYGMEWQARGRYVHERLTAAAERYQEPVREHMAARSYAYKSYWVDNIVVVENGDIGLLNDLASFEGVLRVERIPEVHLIQPERADTMGGPPMPPGPVANLVRVKAPEVWQGGVRGQGIVVANIDSGVRFSHEALREKYRGYQGGTYDHNHNFYDPATSTPGDPNGHGTHVMGTMVGGNASQTTGMAPDATWIACNGFPPSGDAAPFLLQCGEWVAAPTDSTGNNADPNLRPHVVNNSWGNCQQVYNGWYQGVVDTWLAAGIFPSFANGNASNCGYSAPPGLNTVGNPARYRSVFSVGSTSNNDGTYANHSNWGPTDDASPHLPIYPDHGGYPAIKPNIVAPGVSIHSTLNSGDTAYGSSGWTGTSMSAPHVAGLVALMWDAAPCLVGNFGQTGTIIQQTATPIDYNSGGTPAPGPGNVPNYATGWGEINAEAAVLEAMAQCGPQGTITGVVTDSASNPVQGVQIRIDNPNPPPSGWQVLTDANGQYTIVLSEGTYSVTASLYGYESQTAGGVNIVEDQTTTQNFQLVSAPSYTVEGVVSDDDTGWPLHARIDIGGYPGGSIYTDPSDGSYSIPLAGGIGFDFAITVLSGGYEGMNRPVGPLAADTTEDFGLDVDLAACSAPGYDAGALYQQTFEADNGGFTVDGTATWAWGTPAAGWPNGCGGGSSCWATGLSGPYPNSANASVTSPVIDLTGAAAPLIVSWKQANHVETHNWDQAFAEYSIDGGTTWQVMWQNPGATVAEDWRELTYDISAAAGASLQLRWRLVSDGSVNHPGVYFDDIAIRAGSSCTPQAGELVSGTVTDANTSQPLNGALVAVDGADSVLTSTSEDPALGAGAYLLFVPEGAQDIEASHAGYEPGSLSDTFVDGEARRHDFALGAGHIGAAPSPLVSTLVFGGTDTETLALANSGTVDADVTLLARMGIQEHFEAAFPPAGWSAVNNGGTCVWQRNDDNSRPNHAGGDGFSASADSDSCGTGTTMDTRLVSPQFAVTAASALDFVLSYRHLGTSRLDVEISVDDGASWTVLQTWAANLDATGPGAPINIALGAYAGQNARLGFRYVSPGWNWWAQIDQVNVSGTPDWLSLAPDTGTVTVGGTLDVTATFNAAAASITEPGTYHADILIQSDTPYGDIVVPVEMHVQASPTQSRLFGQVTGQGYCDADPGPLAGATVEVTGLNGSHTLTTDANGNYQLWLEVADGPLDLDVSAAGHVGDSVNGVALVGGDEVEQDFALRLDAPCASVDPQSLSASLMSGDTDTQTLTIINQGAAALDWDAVSQGRVAGGARQVIWQQDVAVSDGAASEPRGGSLIWDQSTDGTGGIVSDVFLNNGGDAVYSANDFQIASSQFIAEIHTPGFWNGGDVTNAAAINWYIYPDAGGQPAGHPADGQNLHVWSLRLVQGHAAITIDDNNITLDVVGGQGGTSALGSGTFWLVVAPEVFNAGGLNDRWNWSQGVPMGLPTKLVDPANLFGAGATQWSNLADLGIAWSDVAFTLIGGAPPMECWNPAETPWLALNPGDGSVAAGDEEDVQVTLNAAGLTPGVYETTICVASNDPVNGIITVPVTLEVPMGPNDGTLEGTVQSLGYCSADPAALAGATVEIVGVNTTYTLTTDAAGHYSQVLDVSESPVTVNVMAANHVPGSQTGVTLVAQNSVTADLDLQLNAPCATATPGALSVSLEPDQVGSDELLLINSGAAAYTWEIDTEETVDSAFRGGTVEVVEDGSFEQYNDYWDDSSSTYGTVLCTVADCGTGGGSGPRTGAVWVWFGGASGGDTGHASQEVTIPVGSEATLRFYLEMAAFTQTGWLRVSLGGDQLIELTQADADSHATYQLVEIDVSAYADGGTHELRFASQTTGGGNFHVDDVSLLVQPGPLDCADPQGVAWLLTDPVDGTVAGNSDETVEVLYDSTGLTHGVYKANLCVTTSDAQNPLIVVPVELNVQESGIFEDGFEGDDQLPRGEGDPNRRMPH